MTTLNRPNGGPKRSILSTLYLTHCSVCRLGVYQHEEHEWARKPMGISHSDCLARVRAADRLLEDLVAERFGPADGGF